ncbi:NAD(P)-dependent oxidoreductase [Pseudomonas sp. CGJS7]|uniref:NAD(P)-dependent oxidoreductase n=1 Tax=Pseudomonas sp. CGJS7 TaxID=3109348 RepID=UPI00300AF1D3
MNAKTLKPVLIIGGSGVVGAQGAHALRRLQPDLPIAIAGRDLARAEAVAAQVGNATAVRVDLQRADLGLGEDARFSAVVLFVKDETSNSIKYAQRHGLPYVSTSSGSFEIAPEVTRYLRRPGASPMLLASHWLAGAATLPALHFAQEFRRLDSIRIAALLDEQDMGGPAAAADYERLTSAAAAQILERGRWRWVRDAEAASSFLSVDGVGIQAAAYSPMDVVSLAAATDAHSIRLDMALGESASRRRGEAFSTEIAIELEGELHDGRQVRARHELVHPQGQAPITAVGIALGVERLLGLAGGEAVAPGLYTPDVLIDPVYQLRRLQEFGVSVQRKPDVELSLPVAA